MIVDSVGFNLNINDLKPVNNKKTDKIKSKVKKDSAGFQKNSFNETLVKKYNSDGFLNGHYTMEGSINDKSTYLNISSQQKNLFDADKSYRGVMGDEKVCLKTSGKTVKGQVGDKEVSLVVETGWFGKLSINGKIGNKEIDITTSSSIKETKEENDIITLAVSLKGARINVRDGKIVSHSPSVQQNIENEEKAMLMMATSGQQMKY